MPTAESSSTPGRLLLRVKRGSLRCPVLLGLLLCLGKGGSQPRPVRSGRLSLLVTCGSQALPLGLLLCLGKGGSPPLPLNGLPRLVRPGRGSPLVTWGSQALPLGLRLCLVRRRSLCQRAKAGSQAHRANSGLLHRRSRRASSTCRITASRTSR